MVAWIFFPFNTEFSIETKNSHLSRNKGKIETTYHISNSREMKGIRISKEVNDGLWFVDHQIQLVVTITGGNSQMDKYL